MANQPNHHTGLFLSCDWGTSSFRLGLVDRNTGKIEGSTTSPAGIKERYDHWVNEGNAENRISFFTGFLKKKISELENGHPDNIQDIPVLLSGMASSSIGIKELPYSSLPFSLKQPELQTEVVDKTEAFPHDLVLISGVKSDNDIMRGEETQLIGLALNYNLSDSICILPGTHSKHIVTKDDQMVEFRTFMTGELFELLSSKSILRNSVDPATEITDTDAFRNGLKKAMEENLLHQIFQVRAWDILHKSDKKKHFDFLSGLLIGTELDGLRGQPKERLYLICDEPLRSYYSAALESLELQHTTIKDSEHLTVDGHRHILNKIFN